MSIHHIKRCHCDWGTGRDCCVIKFVLFYLPSRPYKLCVVHPTPDMLEKPSSSGVVIGELDGIAV
jgi:hypothetical protein